MQGGLAPQAGNGTQILYRGKKEPKLIQGANGREFVMGEVLGEGSYGKVKEAVDSQSLRRVAVKIINKRHLRKIRGAEESIKREITIQKRLKHPNVVNLMEVIYREEKDKLYIVMELINGGSLQELMDTFPGSSLPLPLARRFFRQLLQGLEYCHSKGVVHRDVKPSNSMVTNDGNLKIADFGVAELLDQFQDADTLSKSRGSPAFQAPEVASGRAQFSGFKVDAWAAGVTLYMMTTGKAPFEGVSLINLFENISKGEYTLPDKVKQEPKLEEIITGLLQVDHETRLSVSDALAHSWLQTSTIEEDEEKQCLKDIGNRRIQKTTVLPYIARLYGEDFGDETGAGSTLGDNNAVQYPSTGEKMSNWIMRAWGK